LAVDWRCTPVCNCPWERLVLPLEGIQVVTRQLLEQEPALLAGVKLLEHLHPSVDEKHPASELARKAFIQLHVPYCGPACWLDIEAQEYQRLPRLDLVPEEELPTSLQMPCVTVLAFAEFYPPREEERNRFERERSEVLNALRPAPGVAQLVRRLPAGTVGVHARRSDHASARAHSPDELFVQAMEEASPRPGGARRRFFLATDCPESEELLRRRFGGRVQVLGKRTLDRSTPEGIEDAFADLLHLAQCDRIIGSYESTFSKLAALFRRRPLTVLYSRPGVPP